jgi:biotin carboxyl carrier protein
MPTYEVFVDGKPRRIELAKDGEHSFIVKVDGKSVTVRLSDDETASQKKFSLSVDGKEYGVTLPGIDWKKPFQVKVNGVAFKAELKAPSPRTAFQSSATVQPAVTRKMAAKEQAAEGSVTAPMTGKIVSVRVKRGDVVKANQVLCTIEAMKMENEICAPKAGAVQEVLVAQGSSVNEGDTLFVIG